MTEKGSVLVEPTPRIRAVRAAACEECGETRPSLPENEKQNKNSQEQNDAEHITKKILYLNCNSVEQIGLAKKIAHTTKIHIDTSRIVTLRIVVRVQTTIQTSSDGNLTYKQQHGRVGSTKHKETPRFASKTPKQMKPVETWC